MGIYLMIACQTVTINTLLSPMAALLRSYIWLFHSNCMTHHHIILPCILYMYENIRHMVAPSHVNTAQWISAGFIYRTIVITWSLCVYLHVHAACKTDYWLYSFPFSILVSVSKYSYSWHYHREHVRVVLKFNTYMNGPETQIILNVIKKT